MTVTLMPVAREAMRIAMFSDSYLPRISGVVHSVETFVHALRREGHRVVVVAPVSRGFVDTDPDVIRFPSIRPPRHSDFPLAIPYAPAAWRRLHLMDLEIVHTHSPFLMGAVGARLAHRRRLPLVFTHHTLYDEYVHYVPLTPKLTRPLVRWYTTRYANRCDCVIAPSRAIAARLRAQGVRARIEVLATAAIDPAIVASLEPAWVRPTFGLPEDRPLLVTASRLGKEKSVHVVLEAFAQVRRDRDARLLVVGGGPEEGALRQVAQRLGIEAQTVFAGLQPHRKALECMAACDVFVFASQTETQGLAIIEAMAAGAPVVAVDAGGVADAVRDGETGYLVPPSADALAERVIALLENPGLRQALALHARQAAREFSPDMLTRQLMDLYRSLVPIHRR